MAAKTFAALALLLAFALPAGAALTPAAERALDEGLHKLYSLDYAESRQAFHKIIELEPGNPFGYLFESGAIWWQASQEYGLFKDTPTLQGLFEQDVDTAIRTAQTWIDSKDPGLRVDGNFAAGMALGTRGQWHIMRGHYVRAYLDGKHAIKHLKKAAKLDANFYDAYIGLGVYDYQAAHLSGVAKLGGLIGVHGNEKRGLEELRLAAERARYSARQAADFLASIYIIDKQDWSSALPLIERLRKDFPESDYFTVIEGFLRWRMGERAKTVALGRGVFESVKRDPRVFNRKLLTMTCGMADQLCLGAAQAAGIRDWLTAAIEATPEPAAPKPPKPSKQSQKASSPPPIPDDLLYLSLLHLYRGYMADALGRTDEAAAEYDWVLKHPDFSDNHARAQNCLDAGCPAKELLGYLRDKSR